MKSPKKSISDNVINPFKLIRSQCILFYPWKHQKTVRFTHVFRGYGKGALGTNRLSSVFLSCSNRPIYLLRRSINWFLFDKNIVPKWFHAFIDDWIQKRIQNPVSYVSFGFFVKIVPSIFCKKLHLRCLIGFWCLQPQQTT